MVDYNDLTEHIILNYINYKPVVYRNDLVALAALKVNRRVCAPVRHGIAVHTFCHKKYAISVTDAALRKSVSECHRLKEANDKEELPAEEKQRMVELLVMNVQRSKELRELYAPSEVVD